MKHGRASGSVLERVYLAVAHLDTDLLAVAGITTVADLWLVATSGSSPRAITVTLGLLAVVFAPGYALVSAFYPGIGDEADGPRGRQLATGHRLALALALGVALVPLLGLVLAETGALGRLAVLGSVTLVTLGLILVAGYRRAQVPGHRRYGGPHLAGLQSFLGGRLASVPNLAVIATLVVAAGTLGVAVADPPSGERYTSAALLTENESGDLVAAGYPRDVSVGEERSLTLTLKNHEGEPIDYSVFVRLDTGTEVRTVAQFEPTVDDGETWRRQHSVEFGTVGDGQRLSYLVYRGSPEGSVGSDTAYRELHLWLNVSA